MTRFLLLLLIAAFCAPAALAQDKDYSFYEFYVGYAHQRAFNNADHFDRGGLATHGIQRVDFANERVNYNGFTAEFNQNVHRNVGIVTSFTGNFDKTSYFDLNSGTTFDASVRRYDLMIGPRFNMRNSRVTPFAHALFGITHMRAKFDRPLSPHKKSDTAFGMALGGGIDIHASDDIDIRPIMLDYVPTYFNGKRQDNWRAGAGIKIR
jgi:opacity protein-like surface antigen